MTPVALWTGRLPGLRPLPRRRTLWLVGGVVALGAAGAGGLLGAQGPWLGIAASVVALGTVWRHRWPTELPLRLRSLEAPRGPDERAVMVEFRHDGDLIGWDVGILWFEKGGVGFVGRTVSFVVPRTIMGPTLEAPLHWSLFRAPHLTAKVFETTLGIVPLGREMSAQTTLARIEALPDAVTSETILPPSSMHPDLLQRGLTVRRRAPMLTALTMVVPVFPMLARYALAVPPGFVRLLLTSGGLVALFLLPTLGLSLPASIRSRLPKESRRSRPTP